MPQGLQIWDANGVSMLDTSTYTCRLIGIASANGVSGSATFPDLNTGTPFAYFNPFFTGDVTGYNPNISISGTTVFWVYNTPAGQYQPPISGTIFVGVK